MTPGPGQIEANCSQCGRHWAADREQQQPGRNAIRHGLTAETVIGALEDAEDYKAFEAAITADYDAQSAVERELVLRLASLLWRLRRATSMETGLLEIQADHLAELRNERHLAPESPQIVYALFGHQADQNRDERLSLATSAEASPHHRETTSELANPSPVELARCFLRSPICRISCSTVSIATKPLCGAS